jgi:predicted DNA-binding transcriptional regulator AlpA
MPEHTDFLTRGEFAALARVHRRTLELWAAQGFGPRPVRHGPKLIRYHRSEVQTWLREGDEPGWPAADARDGPEAA